jgi:hypothetical protein
LYVHALDQALVDGVDMPDRLIDQDVSSEIAYDLMDVDDNSAIFFFESERLYVWVDHGPLARPVVAYSGVSVDAPAFHSVGPVYGGVHPCEDGFYVTRVESLIHRQKQLPV